MLAPFFLLFITFTVLPVLLSMLLSLTDFNMLEMPSWQGGSNFTRLFLDDDIFLLACQNTLIFAAIVGPVSYIMSFMVAWFINEPGIIEVFCESWQNEIQAQAVREELRRALA